MRKPVRFLLDGPQHGITVEMLCDVVGIGPANDAFEHRKLRPRIMVIGQLGDQLPRTVLCGSGKLPGNPPVEPSHDVDWLREIHKRILGLACRNQEIGVILPNAREGVRNCPGTNPSKLLEHDQRRSLVATIYKQRLESFDGETPIDYSANLWPVE